MPRNATAARPDPEEDDRLSLRLWLQLIKASKAIEGDIGTRFRRTHGQSFARFDVLSQLYRSDGDWTAIGVLGDRLMTGSGNITALDSEFTAPTLGIESSLPGTSDLIYNTSVWFEEFGLSVRLNYQYRDDWLSTTENDSLNEFWAEEERIDLSVRYVLPLGNNFPGVVTLFANANNLSDYVDVRYSNSPRTPNQVEQFGERYLIGIRVDY